MLILFDHGAPRGLRRAFGAHTVITAYSRGWDRLTNGMLLDAAEASDIDVLITADQNMRYQQNLTGRRIAIVVLTGAIKWSRMRLHFASIVAAVNAATPGSYTDVHIPYR